MSCCPPDTTVGSFWNTHLLLDSSFEHADSMDLQPSTKDIRVSYQNCLKNIACSFCHFNHQFYEVISGLPVQVFSVCLGFFVWFLVFLYPTERHSYSPSTKVRHVSKTIFTVSTKSLPQNPSCTASTGSQHRHKILFQYRRTF